MQPVMQDLLATQLAQVQMLMERCFHLLALGSATFLLLVLLGVMVTRLATLVHRLAGPVVAFRRLPATGGGGSSVYWAHDGA